MFRYFVESSKLLARLSGYYNMRKMIAQYLPSDELKTIVKGKTIVFPTIRCADGDLVIDGLFAAMFKKANAKDVCVILDDGVYDHWDMSQYDTAKPAVRVKLNPMKSRSRFDKWLIKKIIKATYGVRFIFVSDIQDKISLDEDDMRDKNIENNVTSSCRRYFQTSRLDFENNADHKRYYDLCYQNALLGLKIGKYIIQNIKPDISITTDGVYSVLGSVHEYLKKNGVSALVKDALGYRSEYTLALNRTPVCLIDNETKRWASFRNNGLQKNEREIIASYFDKRINKIGFENSMFFKSGDTIDFKVKGKPVFVLFPNVIWDGNIFERDIIFKDIIEWIEETVRFFIKNPDKGHLIIRFHPSESTLLDGSLKLEDIIRKEFGEQLLYETDNVTVISSDVYVNSYKVIKELADVCIVYDNTIAVESVYLRKPAIIVGRGKYREKGFSFDPINKQEYFDLLSTPQNMISSFNAKYSTYLDNMYKYSYFAIFHIAMEIPTLKYDFKEKCIRLNYQGLNQESRALLEKSLIKTLNEVLQ